MMRSGLTRKCRRACSCQPDELLLVVEYDSFARLALAHILTAHGYNTDTAADSREALIWLSQFPPPALILLALDLPDAGTWDLCKRCVRDPRLADVPVAVVSANKPARAWAASLGIAGHLRKPVQVDELLSQIGRWCHRA
jgi:CheY-like chemotaxis protein